MTDDCESRPLQLYINNPCTCELQENINTITFSMRIGFRGSQHGGRVGVQNELKEQKCKKSCNDIVLTYGLQFLGALVAPPSYTAKDTFYSSCTHSAEDSLQVKVCQQIQCMHLMLPVYMHMFKSDYFAKVICPYRDIGICGVINCNQIYLFQCL